MATFLAAITGVRLRFSDPCFSSPAQKKGPAEAGPLSSDVANDSVGDVDRRRARRGAAGVAELVGDAAAALDAGRVGVDAVVDRRDLRRVAVDVDVGRGGARPGEVHLHEALDLLRGAGELDARAAAAAGDRHRLRAGA